MQQLKTIEQKKLLYSKYGICKEPSQNEIWLLTDSFGNGQQITLKEIKEGVNNLLNKPQLDLKGMMGFINNMGSI